MMAMKMDANKVLGLPGIGPKAMQNIEETLTAITFPEPETPPAEPAAELAAEPVAVADSQPAADATPAEPVAVAEVPATEKQIPAKKEARKVVEEEEDEHAKDGVSLDELFAMKPEIFQNAGSEDDESADRKKGKKGKKKSVELVLDEERGEVVGRKKHKRGDDVWRKGKSLSMPSWHGKETGRCQRNLFACETLPSELALAVAK
jgi:nucleoid-associated protein YgaU